MLSPRFPGAPILNERTNALGNWGEKWSRGFLHRALEWRRTMPSSQKIYRPKGEEKTSPSIAFGFSLGDRERCGCLQEPQVNLPGPGAPGRPAGRVEPCISRGAWHLHLQASRLHPNTREHGECVASVPAEMVSQPSFQSHTRLASQIFKAAAPSLKISHSVLQSEGFPVPKEAPPRQPSLTGPDAWCLAPYQALLILQPLLCRLTSLPMSPLCVWGGRGGRDSGLW